MSNSDVWERKRAQMSLRIECAGLELLSERGLGEVTVEQIATAAGISTRTFFRYFRNVNDVLTAVPVREGKRICRVLMARPSEEGLLEAFHSVFAAGGAAIDAAGENAALELEAVRLWSEIVRTAPDIVQSESRASSSLAAELEPVVRDRLRDGADDDEVVGVLSVAFAAVIWFVFTRAIEQGDGSDLSVHLDKAVRALASLHGSAGSPGR
ncbi:MAG TPA: TetR family transcriptional regulator [Acidimicrobiia bacterium]|nr:TetR family transcriptional regulator [Acidimicrobiia bacterium]